MPTGGITAASLVPKTFGPPVTFRSDGSAAAEFRADIDCLFANGKIADYLSGDRDRTARAHASLSYIFYKIGGMASFLDRCVSEGLYQEPRMAAALKHLIEGFVGTDDRAILLHQTRRLKTRAHPDKTGALLGEIDSKQKAIVAKRIWRLYSSILDVVSNKEVLNALYGAASHAHEQDLYEPSTASIHPLALRRWLRRPRYNTLALWKGIAVTAAAIAKATATVGIGIAIGACTQVLLQNSVAACIAGATAGIGTYWALRQLLA